jgi:hypothetical protein
MKRRIENEKKRRPSGTLLDSVQRKVAVYTPSAACTLLLEFPTTQPPQYPRGMGKDGVVAVRNV